MTTANHPQNQQPQGGATDLGQISKKKTKNNECPSGRPEHTWEPEWKGRGYDYLKCRFCGKRTPA